MTERVDTLETRVDRIDRRTRLLLWLYVIGAVINIILKLTLRTP